MLRHQHVIKRAHNIALSAGLCLGVAASAASPSHIGEPAETRAIAYLQSCFGRPVAWVDALSLINLSSLPECRTGDEKSRKAVEAALVQQGIRLVYGQDILVVITERTANQPQDWMLVPPKWNGAKLTVNLQNYERSDAQDSSEPEQYEKVNLSQDEMQKFARQILEASRLIRIRAPGSSVPPSIISDPKRREEARRMAADYVPVDLEIRFDARRFRRDGPVSIIALITEHNGAVGRIVYGELQNGICQILWDSIEFFFADGPDIGYADVNADGRPEILLRTDSGGMRVQNPMLAILDLNGKELTRETRDCMPHGAAIEDALCFIMASEFSYRTDAEGKTVIVAAQDFEAGSEPPREYHWIEGRFVDINSRHSASHHGAIGKKRKD